MKRLVCFLILLSSLCASAQVSEPSNTLPRHFGSVRLGLIGSAATSFQLGYEYRFFVSQTSNWRLGLTTYLVSFNATNDDGLFFSDFAGLSTRFQALYDVSGGNGHWLETQIGLMGSVETKRDQSGALPSVAFGYRYHPEVDFVGIQVGFGFPELVNFGLTVQFD